MSWITENKSAAITLGVGSVLTLVLVGAGFKFSSEATDSEMAYHNKLSAIKDLEASPTTPEPQKVKELAESIATYADRVNQLKERLTDYGVEEIKPVTGQAFNNALKVEVVGFEEQAKARGIVVPEDFYMGFEEYRQKLPKSEAAGYLSYELSATSWLFDQMLDNGLERVISVVRKPIQVEQTPTAAPPRGVNARPNAASAAPPKVMVRMPIEFVVEMRKESWAKVLTSIASAEAEHFFIVRGLRIVNERTEGPSKTDITFEGPADEAAPDAEGFEFLIPSPEEGTTDEDNEAEEDGEPGGAGAEIPTEAQGEDIVKSVLGTEHVFVALQLEIIHFLPDVKIPGAAKKKTPAPTPATPAN